MFVSVHFTAQSRRQQTALNVHCPHSPPASTFTHLYPSPPSSLKAVSLPPTPRSVAFLRIGQPQRLVVSTPRYQRGAHGARTGGRHTVEPVLELVLGAHLAGQRRSSRNDGIVRRLQNTFQIPSQKAQKPMQSVRFQVGDEQTHAFSRPSVRTARSGGTILLVDWSSQKMDKKKL